MSKLEDHFGKKPVTTETPADAGVSSAQPEPTSKLGAFFGTAPQLAPPAPAPVLTPEGVPDEPIFTQENAANLWQFGVDTIGAALETGSNIFSGQLDQARERMVQRFAGQDLKEAMTTLDEFTRNPEGTLLGMPMFWNPEMERQRLIDRQKSAEEAGVRIVELQTLIRDSQARADSLTPQDLSTIEQGLRIAPASFFDMTPSLAAGVVTRQPALAIEMMGPMVESLSFAEAATDDLSLGEATTKAFIDGTIEKLTELMPVQILGRMFGPEVLKASGDMRKELMKFVLTEMAGEQAATLLETANNLYFELDPELAAAQTAEEKLAIQGQRQLLTAIGTIAGASLQAGTVGLAQQLDQHFRSEKHKEAEFKDTFVGPFMPGEIRKAEEASAQALREFETAVEETLAQPRPTSRLEKLLGRTSLADITVTRPQPAMDQIASQKVVRHEGDWTTYDSIPEEEAFGKTFVEFPSTITREKKQLVARRKELREGLRQTNQMMAEMLPTNPEVAPQLLSRKRLIEDNLQQTNTGLRELARTEQDFNHFLGDAQRLVQQWQTRWVPEISIVLGDMHAEVSGNGLAPRNVQSLGHAVTTPGQGFIGMNPFQFERTGGGLDTKSMYHTLAHEFGHVLANQQFAELGPKAQKAIHLEYLAFLETAEGQATLTEAGQARQAGLQRVPNFSIAGRNLPEDGIRRLQDLGAKSFTDYYFSFNEYMAQQMAKYQTYNPQARKVAEPFFKRVVSRLKKFFEKERDNFAPGMVYEKWLDARAAGTQLEAARAAFPDAAAVTPETFHPMHVPQLQEQQMQLDVQKYEDIHGPNQVPLRELLNAAEIPVGGEVMDDLSGKRDNFSKFKGIFLNLLQIAKRNPHIPGLATPTQFEEAPYVQLMRQMSQSRIESGQRVEEVLTDWQKLGSKQAEKVGAFLTRLDQLSFSREERITQEEQRTIAAEFGLNEDAWQQAGQLQRMFRNSLDRMENALADQVLRTVDDLDRQEALLDQISSDMAALRKRNFFPSGRFGKHVVIVRATEGGVFEDRPFKKGDTLIREHYSSKADADSRMAELKKSNLGRKHTVFRDKVKEDSAISFRDMPPALLQAIRDLVPADQQQALNDAIVRTTPGRGFAKHLVKKRGVSGASQDYMKSLLSYMRSFEQHIERIEYSDRIDRSIAAVNQSIRQIQDAGGDATTRRQIMEWMQEHKQYMFNPGNEFKSLSALAFNFYLAAVPKQAVLNIMQVPTVVLPQLSARYGPIAAELELAKANKIVFDKKFDPRKLDPLLREAYAQAEQEGIIDQSYVHEVAALNQADNLRRIMPSHLMGSKRAAQIAKLNGEVSKLGAWLFHKAEIFTRRLTFTAAWNLEMKKSGDKLWAYQAAREAVQSGNFEYADYNRPKIFRGKGRPFTIFLTHMQNYLEFLMGDNPGRWGGLAILFLLTGMQGLPFAEDILDFADWAWRKFNKLTGEHQHPSARAALRNTVHDMVETVNEDSAAFTTDVLLNGMGKYGFGLPWLAERGGVPMPYFDLTGSMSLGDIIPGTAALNARTVREGIGLVAEETAGAGFAIPLSVIQAMSDESGDPMKRAQKLAPKFIANPLKAIEYNNRGATNKAGIPIVEFQEDNPLHQGEIIAQALGFPSTRVNIERERRWEEKKFLTYYQVQRSLLADQYVQALQAEDAREAVKDVLQAIDKFNKTVPHPSLGVNAKRLKSSIRSKIRHQNLTKQGVPPGLGDRAAASVVSQTFPDLEAERVEIEPRSR